MNLSGSFVHKKKIVFLYTELAGYVLSCITELVRQGAEVLVYRYPVNNEAPFKFSDNYNFTLLDSKKYSSKEMLDTVVSFNPDLVVCSGWADKSYTSVCRVLHKRGVKTVVCFDNQWKGSLKQLIASFLSPFLLRNKFTYAWVPGKSQKKFARKLGFKENEISTGFYTADTEFWSSVYYQFLDAKKKNFPKRFLYAGRYYSFKGLTELWSAFAAFSNEFPEWELWCVGTGDLPRAEHEKIKHFGFVQPADMADIIKDTGVFILPSRFEPWGVVVHEMATAGFPMILSTAVGAGEIFLQEEKNGFLFPKENTQELINAMKKIALLNNDRLIEMGKCSHELGRKISTGTWTDTIFKIVNN